MVQETELASQVASLQVELSRANELVNSLQKKGGEALPVSPIPAEVTALFKSGMSATQLYTKLVEVRSGGEGRDQKGIKYHASAHQNICVSDIRTYNLSIYNCYYLCHTNLYFWLCIRLYLIQALCSSY